MAPGQTRVVASQATGFAEVYGFQPDFEFNPSDANVPDLSVYLQWSTEVFLLNLLGDQVVVLDAQDQVVDAALYGQARYPGVYAHPGVNEAGHSLERYPKERDSQDCSQDFIERYPPSPGQ